MKDYKELYNNLVDKIISLNTEYVSNMRKIKEGKKSFNDNFEDEDEYLKNKYKLEVIHELLSQDNIMSCVEYNNGYWSDNDGYIILEDSSNGDSRTSKKSPSLTEIKDAVEIHISDVDKALDFWKKLLSERQGIHDWTKLDNFEDEYGFLVHNGVKDEIFLKSEWWHKHITKERHHLQYYVPIDVNLIDVLELISDRVVAEKGRTGEIIPEYLEMDMNILKDAYWNTVKLLDDKTRRTNIDKEE